MTDSTATSHSFAEMQAAREDAAQADRRRNIVRVVACAAVVLVHIAALILILAGSEIPIIKRIKETIPEAITWIPMPKPAPNPKKIEPKPEEQEVTPIPPILTAPITLPPVRRTPLAPPASSGLEGVGRSLACGAGNFENLPLGMREQCRRHPWAFVKRPDGTIVLDAPPKPADAPTTADVMRHEQETAPPCPVLQNVPCLGKIMHGDPLGGQPQPF